MLRCKFSQPMHKRKGVEGGGVLNRGNMICKTMIFDIQKEST